MPEQQIHAAEAFLQLHHGPEILVLPNAWDVTSAKLFEQASFPAIGTTSSGIAASLGYQDGEQIPFKEMLAAIERIVKNTAIPVNADIEAGYGKNISELLETIKRVLQTGTAGINLEDSSRNPEQPLFAPTLQADKIRAVRETANAAGIPLVINARIDTYLHPFHDQEARFVETVDRAHWYCQAGADCIFVPGRLDAAIISSLVAAIKAPLNVLASPVTPGIPELKTLGVARLSLGAGAFRAALAVVRNIANELAGFGTYDALFHDTLTKGDVDSLLRRSV